MALLCVETKFRVMTKGLCELFWLRRLLTDIGFTPNYEMDLFSDNKVAKEISYNLIQHDHTKNIEVDRNFIKQNLEEKII